MLKSIDRIDQSDIIKKFLKGGKTWSGRAG